MSAVAYRKLRAPEADGAALIDPPLLEVPAIIAANRAAASNRDSELGMQPGFCAAARRMMLAGESALTDAQDSHAAEIPRVIMAGHQPTLFHPGVWFKNFLLARIGAITSSAAINLVVDTDTVHSASIRVPTRDNGHARVVDVAFDGPGEEVPWEERYLIEPELFETFAARARAVLMSLQTSGIHGKPLLLDRLWPIATQECARTASAERELRAATSKSLDAAFDSSIAKRRAMPSLCVVSARHRIEQEAGLVSHELPLSSLAYWHHFHFFAEALIARHEEFRQIHNAALVEYRALNGIRSRSHPVPELARDGEWVEVPLWMWSADNPRRRRAFVRSRPTGWELTDREGISLAVCPSGNPNHPALFDAARRGIKIRPRALVTTMYARLVLCDVFIHGIGGAKYDELTDEIIRRCFGVEPPRYLTATATFRLPIDRPSVTIDDVRAAARLVRDVRYRPDTLVGHPLVASDASLERELQALAAEKREYVRKHSLRRASHDVFAGLDRINASLVEKLKPLEDQLRAEHARLGEQFRQLRLLGSREFSFVLFPEEYLVPRLLALAAAEN